jgi:hypothetical protein
MNTQVSQAAREAVLIQKAATDLARLGTLGRLNQQQADDFILVATKTTTLSPMATLKMVERDRVAINELKFSGPVLFPASEGRALSSDKHYRPVFQGPQVTCQLHRAVFPLTYEAIEENIAGDALLNYMLGGGSQAIGRDIEIIGTNGDTSLTDDGSLLTEQLLSMDGVIAQATTHVYLAASPNEDLFANTLEQIPSEFAKTAALRFFASHKTLLQYRRFRGSRQTVGGDKWIENDVPMDYGGVGIVRDELFDEAHGTSSKCTDLLLCDPKNIALVVRRQVLFEMDRDILSGTIIIAVSTKFVWTYIVEDAVARAENVKVLA